MRVAVVAEWYPSPADPVHGIWAHRQVLATARAGTEMRVLALRRPVPPVALARHVMRTGEVAALRRWADGARQSLATTRLDGIDVQAVPWLGPPRPISYGSWGYWMAPPLGRALDRLREGWEFDVVHAHCLAPAGHATARWVARQLPVARPAFVVSAHGPDMIHIPERSGIGRHVCRFTLRRADHVIANSTWAERRCRELASASLPVSVVHLGAELVARPSGSNGGVRLVTVAHLQARKQHDVVLRALARLQPERRPEYVVIGDGEERERLERLAAQLGLAEGVRFLGQLRNEQAVAEVAGGDLFVMPSGEEPFGGAFVEAMAAGGPAIGGRGQGGPQDIAGSGEGMLLVTPGDVGELAALLDRLCADRLELRRLANAARATAEANFTWARCGERTLAAYRAALARRG
jgi:glycosyltransferase involved in cell wall biosynthesis